MIWMGDTWTCLCGFENATIRKRCRSCDETKEFVELSARIGAKSAEIKEALPGVCEWKTRTAAEIAALPDSDD